MSTSKPGNPHTPPGGAGAGSPSSASSAASNAYTRFIPREELGTFSAWAPQTFEPPVQPRAGEDGGVRKPTLAERAAAEMRPSMKSPQQPVRHATQSAPPPAQPARARPAAAAAPRAKPAPLKRPILGGVPGEEPMPAQADEAPREPAIDIDQLVREAKQSGYQDGYRNGLAALESYKQTQAAQMAAYMSDQVGALASDFHQRLESLEQQLAGRIAGVALELARQVVRSEIRQRPEVVLEVAEQALGTLLASARQIVLRLHPDDQAMAQAQLAEVLAARGARVVPDAGIVRGGCIVESDIAVVDASVEARWERAAASMGHDAPWNDGREAMSSTEMRLPDGEDTLEDWPDNVNDSDGEGGTAAAMPQGDDA